MPLSATRLICLTFATCFVSSGFAMANDAIKPSQPAASNAVGASKGWTPKIDGSRAVAGKTYDEVQIKQIERVNAYFNNLVDLQGRFVQSTSDNQRSKGRFFVKRPGKFRFNYSAPSKLVILSDGRFLSIEDHDLDTTDRYPLESTPFRLLLAKKVDILRDAQVIDLFEADKLLALTIRDKSGDAPGTIKLFFEKGEEDALQLKEWVISDAQGVDTRIEVGRLVIGQKVDPNIFMPTKSGFPTSEN